MTTRQILDCSLAAYTVGWCLFFGLLVVRSWFASARPPQGFARPRLMR